MTTIRPIRETALSALLWLAGWMNILLLLALLAGLLAATPQAAAQAPVCRGADMMAALQRDDPDLLAEIQREAARTLNGHGLLWRIEPAGGGRPSHLFGTMHVTDARVLDLGDSARAAFDAADTVAIETTDVLDTGAMMAAMMAQPELTMFTDGTRLSTLIPPEDLPMVEAALAARGTPLASVDMMKPWLLSALVALPACELQRKALGKPILDIMLAEDAETQGKRLVGLESMADQLGAMASLPMELHVEALVETLRLGDIVEDVLETMVSIYQAEELGMFWPFFRATLPSGEDGDAGYAMFEEVMVTVRNRNMAERATPLIEEGGAFIAVGALHLPGEEGLVELLREAGYEVSPASH